MEIDDHSEAESDFETLRNSHKPGSAPLVFRDVYYLKDEKSVSPGVDYVLHMCGTNWGSQIKMGVALSNITSGLYTIGEKISLDSNYKHHEDTITDIKFMPNDPRIFLTSGLDGKIVVCDSRHSRVVREYSDTEPSVHGEEVKKPFTSFDISHDGRILCGATEVVDGNSYIVFWDIRRHNVLGGYWQSHTDDITDVSFNPVEKYILCSGSIDGLVNVFDVTQTNEDDALIQSLNTESSVSKVKWLGGLKDKNNLGVITYTEDIQLWDSNGSFPSTSLSRTQLAAALNLKGKNSLYVSDLHQKNDRPFFLCGSSLGNGNVMKAVELSQSNTLVPTSDFSSNRQVVRSSWYDAKLDVLVTGGEGSFLSLWAYGDPATKTKKPQSGKR